MSRWAGEVAVRAVEIELADAVAALRDALDCEVPIRRSRSCRAIVMEFTIELRQGGRAWCPSRQRANYSLSTVIPPGVARHGDTPSSARPVPPFEHQGRSGGPTRSSGATRALGVKPPCAAGSTFDPNPTAHFAGVEGISSACAKLDNQASRKTPAVKPWLLKHPQSHLHFAPDICRWHLTATTGPGRARRLWASSRSRSGLALRRGPSPCRL